MEFEDVSPEVEREARHVIAAFRLGEWGTDIMAETYINYGNDLYISIMGVGETGLINLEVYEDHIAAEFYGEIRRPPEELWILCPKSIEEPDYFFNRPRRHREVLKAAYRLGYDISLFPHLGELTAHEKMEMRLSMPREFWPKNWLDEEAK